MSAKVLPMHRLCPECPPEHRIILPAGKSRCCLCEGEAAIRAIPPRPVVVKKPIPWLDLATGIAGGLVGSAIWYVFCA
jgi:hypothetical protein